MTGADDGRAETLQGQILGTPAYMSPEQAAGRHDELTIASDVYSLGAILYEILTGQPPFTGSDTQELLNRVMYEAPVRPRARVTGVPAALEAICLKALGKQPPERYATAAALADDVRHWQADEPVTAYREALPTRLARWGRRHRPVVAAAAALLVATVAGLALGTVLLGRANVQIEYQREEARAQRDLAQAGFRKARQAVDDYFTKVSENKLLQSLLPGLQPLRKELLQLALAYYQDFVREHQDDPELRKDLAAAYLRLGSISADIDSVEKALALDERGVRLCEELANANPKDSYLRRQLGRARNQVGDHFMRIGRDTEALTNLENAVAIHKDLVRLDSADHVAAYDLALALNTRGIFLSSQLHSARALETYQDAAAILENLKQGPEEQERLRLLSLIYNNVAAIYIHNVGPSIKAIPVLERALSIQKTLAKKGFSDPENQRIVSLIYYNLGLSHENNQHDREARQYYEEMIALGDKLARENPTVAAYRAALAENYRILGRFHRRRHRAKEALEALQAAAATIDKVAAEHLKNTDYQKTRGLAHNSLALLYMELGRAVQAEQSFQRALDALDPVIQTNPKNRFVIVYAADVYGNLATLLRGQDRLVESVAAFEKGAKLLEKLVLFSPKDYLTASISGAYHSVALAEVKLTLGDPAAARILLRQAQDMLTDSAGAKVYTLWRRAGLHAQLGRLVGLGKPSLTPQEESERRQHFDQAMSFLRRALAERYPEPQELKSDHTFDPLRERPDFKKLLEEVKAQHR